MSDGNFPTVMCPVAVKPIKNGSVKLCAGCRFRYQRLCRFFYTARKNTSSIQHKLAFKKVQTYENGSSNRLRFRDASQMNQVDSLSM